MKNKNILIILILIVLIGGALRFYKIGVHRFHRDEFFEINASYGYFKTGEWLVWDFNNDKPFDEKFQKAKKWSNERAQSYRLQLAALYHFAEPTETNTRAISAVWGVISIIAVYFIVLSFTGNVYIALLAAFLAAVGESGILFTRRLRMYAMLFPVYLFFSWTVYKLYESRYNGKFSFFRKIYQKLEINPNYLVPAVLAGLISYEIHEVSTSIVAAIIAYCFIFAVRDLLKKRFFSKYILTLAAVLAGYVFASAFFSGAAKLMKESISFLNRKDWEYIQFYFADFRFIAAGAVLVILGAWFLAVKLKKTKESVFLLASAFAPLAFAVSSWVRTPAHRYIYFIQSFGIILAAVGVYALIDLILKRFPEYKKIIAAAITILFLATLNFSYIFGKNNFYRKIESGEYVDFVQLFSYVRNNWKPGDVMITRSYRSYYFQDWQAPIYDIKDLPFEKSDCRELFKKIMAENKSGWIIIPEVDNLSICKDGKQFLYNELGNIKSKEIPDQVFVCRWGD